MEEDPILNRQFCIHSISPVAGHGLCIGRASKRLLDAIAPACDVRALMNMQVARGGRGGNAPVVLEWGQTTFRAKTSLWSNPERTGERS